MSKSVSSTARQLRARLFSELDDALDAGLANGNTYIWHETSGKWKVSTAKPPTNTPRYYRYEDGKLHFVDASWLKFVEKWRKGER